MATSGRPRSSAIDHPTRQQLDDLDALMQRMLALPVSPLEESPAPSAPARTDVSDPPPASTEAAVLPPQPAANGDIGENAAKNGPADQAMQRASQQERSETLSTRLGTQYAGLSSQYLLPSSRYSGRGTPPAVAPHLPQIQPQMPAPAVLETTAQAPQLAWPLLPLLWLTWAFDYGTAWQGPLGRWLRGPSGRALLGWGGLLLLAAALAWVVWDGMAWSW